MSQVYLIDQATFIGYEDISVNIKPERIKVFVKKAQDLDLKPFMGAAFYYDFIQWFNDDGTYKDDTPQPVKDLFDGVEYIDTHGHTLQYEGMIPALVYFTFARFIEADAVHYTATGPVVKRHESADAVEPRNIAKLVAQQRSVANAHTNEIERFLEDNKESYPLWRFNERNKNSRQPGARIRGIDKTNNGRANYGGYDEFNRFW